MRIITVAMTLLFGVVGAFSSTVLAAEQSPMKLLKETQEKVEKLIRKEIKPSDAQAKIDREKKVQSIVEPFFNFKMLAKRSLGKHWKTLKPVQQKEFTFWFKELLQQAYLGGVRAGDSKRSKHKHELKYKKEKIEGNTAKVFTLIKYQVVRRKRKRWKKVYVDWSFIKQKTGWKVTDISTNENSLMETYQEEFDKLITKKSFAALVAKIKKKVIQLRKKHGLPGIANPAKVSPAKK